MARQRGAARLGLVALVALATGGAGAQDHAPRPNPLQGTTSQFLLELGARLNLSEERRASLFRLKKEFQAKHRDELKQLRQEFQRVHRAAQQARQNKNTLALAQARGQARELRRSAETLRAEFEKQLLDVLTDAQKDTYRSLRKELSRKVTR